jgi:hypothetical protein
VLASAAYGFLKGLTQVGRERFHAEQDLFGPAKEEFLYRGVPLWAAPNLPYGSTAVTFAADHVMGELKRGSLQPNAAAARFGDVLLGGALYETAFRQFGLLGAIGAHVAHNLAIGWGTRARRHWTQAQGGRNGQTEK